MSDPVPATPFVAFEGLLEHIDSALAPAESHGLLCGLLCAAGEGGYDRWLEQVAGEVAPDAADEVPLRALAAETGRQLDDSAFGFCLLLPGDEVGLAERARALGEWCHGFIVGLGLGEGEPTDDDVREVLGDLAEISRVSVQPADCDTEEDEASYAELVEYVRVAVLLVHEHLRQPPVAAPSAAPGEPFLH